LTRYSSINSNDGYRENFNKKEIPIPLELKYFLATLFLGNDTNCTFKMKEILLESQKTFDTL